MSRPVASASVVRVDTMASPIAQPHQAIGCTVRTTLLCSCCGASPHEHDNAGHDREQKCAEADRERSARRRGHPTSPGAEDGVAVVLGMAAAVPSAAAGVTLGPVDPSL